MLKTLTWAPAILSILLFTGLAVGAEVTVTPVTFASEGAGYRHDRVVELATPWFAETLK